MNETGKKSVRETLDVEGLGHFNWFEDRELWADEVGIVGLDSGWRVYVTDERANARYDEVHTDESAAVIDFLNRVRALSHVFVGREERCRRSSSSSEGQSS